MVSFLHKETSDFAAILRQSSTKFHTLQLHWIVRFTVNCPVASQRIQKIPLEQTAVCEYLMQCVHDYIAMATSGYANIPRMQNSQNIVDAILMIYHSPPLCSAANRWDEHTIRTSANGAQTNSSLLLVTSVKTFVPLLSSAGLGNSETKNGAEAMRCL